MNRFIAFVFVSFFALTPMAASAQSFSLPVQGDGWWVADGSGDHEPKSYFDDTHAADLNRGAGKDDFNQPVYATLGGVVLRAAWEDGFGKNIIIDHRNGFLSRYSHLNSYAVGKDDEVQQGDFIGRVGATGGNYSPHLHFSVYRKSSTRSFWDAYPLSNVAGYSALSHTAVGYSGPTFVLANSPAVSAGRELTTEDINTVVGSVIPGGLQNIFVWAIGVGAIIAFGIIVFGGIMRITSAGDSSKISEGNAWIKAAVYGMLLLMLGWLLLYTINPTLVGQ